MARNTRLERKGLVINQDKDIKSVNCFSFALVPAGQLVLLLTRHSR